MAQGEKKKIGKKRTHTLDPLTSELKSLIKLLLPLLTTGYANPLFSLAPKYVANLSNTSTTQPNALATVSSSIGITPGGRCELGTLSAGAVEVG